MSKALRKTFILAVLALCVSLYASVAASAAEEKRFDYGDGNYVTISNVIEVKPVEGNSYSDTLYVLKAPATVTFHGKFSEDTQIAEWEDEESLNYVEIKDNAATLTNPVLYGVFPVLEGKERSYDHAIVLQVTGGDEASQETAPAPATQPEQPQADSFSTAPTSANVVVNGKAVAFEAYNIDGNNFFKLRDLAASINGTDKNFEVSWDDAANAISLTSKQAYTPDGSELSVSEQASAKQAVPTTSKVLADGNEVTITAYNIDGNNYFKLRDVAKVINFGVTWDDAANSIGIDTKADYTE